MTDLSDKLSARPSLERFWDALKKVIRLHKELYPDTNNFNSKVKMIADV
jgi:hypothetical protein